MSSWTSSILVLLAFTVVLPASVEAQTPVDSATIRTTAQDYIEGW